MPVASSSATWICTLPAPTDSSSDELESESESELLLSAVLDLVAGLQPHHVLVLSAQQGAHALGEASEPDGGEQVDGSWPVQLLEQDLDQDAPSRAPSVERVQAQVRQQLGHVAESFDSRSASSSSHWFTLLIGPLTWTVLNGSAR